VCNCVSCLKLVACNIACAHTDARTHTHTHTQDLTAISAHPQQISCFAPVEIGSILEGLRKTDQDNRCSAQNMPALCKTRGQVVLFALCCICKYEFTFVWITRLHSMTMDDDHWTVHIYMWVSRQAWRGSSLQFTHQFWFPRDPTVPWDLHFDSTVLTA
jgi:hypothetical protein